MDHIFNNIHFKHRFPVQVRFSDVDMMGHVNNACYFNYAELARLNYYGHAVGFDTDWYQQHGLIMARFEIDYKKAISYGDEVFVYTKCARIGTTSFDLAWIICIGASDEETIAAVGKTVI